MITLATPGDYLFVFLLASTAGLLGGLAAELLLNRGGDTGTFELPVRKGAFFDLGGLASLIVGAVVGVAILIVFPPETTIVTNAAGGASTSLRSYDTVRLVATSLVAGSAGGSVLTALQARVTAAVNESRVQWTAAAGQHELERLRDTATAEASSQIRAMAAVMERGEAAGARPRGALGDVPPPTAEGRADAADAAIAALSTTLARETEHSRSAVATAARGSSAGQRDIT